MILAIGVDGVVGRGGGGAAWSAVITALNAPYNTQHETKYRRFHRQATRIRQEGQLMGDGGDGSAVDVTSSSACGQISVRLRLI